MMVLNLLIVFCLLMCSCSQAMQKESTALTQLYAVSTTLKNIYSLPADQQETDQQCQKETLVLDALELFNKNNTLSLADIDHYTPLLFSNKAPSTTIDVASFTAFATFADYLDINKKYMIMLLKNIYIYDKKLVKANETLCHLLHHYCNDHLRTIGYQSIKPQESFLNFFIPQTCTLCGPSNQECNHTICLKKLCNESNVTLNTFNELDDATKNSIQHVDFAFDNEHYIRVILKELNLSSICGLDSFIKSFLVNPACIQHIDISDNNIAGIFDIDALMYCVPNVEYIDLHNNKIQSFSGLQHHSSVKTVVCDKGSLNNESLCKEFHILFPRINTIFLVHHALWYQYTNEHSAWIYQNAQSLSRMSDDI